TTLAQCPTISLTFHLLGTAVFCQALCENGGTQICANRKEGVLLEGGVRPSHKLGETQDFNLLLRSG
ncbi:MAG: hypothetical protein QW652_06200, partial [Candidatus Nitrosotenuis sp.]